MPIIQQIKFKLYTVLICTMGLFLCCFGAMGQNFYLETGQKKGTLEFKLIKNLIVIPIYINEKGPFNFILDTGVAPMIITEHGLIDSLKIKNVRNIKIYGIGKGNEIDAVLTNDVRVKIGTSSSNAVATAILKKDVFNLSGYLGMPISGLIGHEFFSSFIVKINYSEKRVVFYTHDSEPKIKGQKIPIQIVNNKPYILSEITNSTGETVLAKLIIDTGASHALSLESLNNKAYPTPAKTIEADLGMGISGPISGVVGRVAQLKIGTYVSKDVVSSFPFYDDIISKVFQENRNGNLGADFLKRFTVVFDYENQCLYLNKNSLFKTPFEYNMSGIELYLETTPNKKYLIRSVDPHSPGEIAGLLPNDEVISLNFKDVDTYSLDDINGLFKSGEGRRVIIGIFRNERTSFKVVELKQRI